MRECVYMCVCVYVLFFACVFRRASRSMLAARGSVCGSPVTSIGCALCNMNFRFLSPFFCHRQLVTFLPNLLGGVLTNILELVIDYGKRLVDWAQPTAKVLEVSCNSLLPIRAASVRSVEEEDKFKKRENPIEAIFERRTSSFRTRRLFLPVRKAAWNVDREEEFGRNSRHCRNSTCSSAGLCTEWVSPVCCFAPLLQIFLCVLRSS